MEKDKPDIFLTDPEPYHLQSPSSLCAHQLFEKQVERSPEAVAIIYMDRQLTYRELNNRANQLASFLKKFDVGPNILVAICVERSLEMVIGILGILKAGGAYIPLDPEYPEERLAYMLEDSNAPILLTQAGLKKNLAKYVRKVICLDEEWDTIAKESINNPKCEVTPGNLIYVIYTSGSTGKPKGSLLYHRGFVNLLIWYTKEFIFNMESRALLMTSLSFDLTQKNLYAPLITGGRLVLLESQHYDAHIILRSIVQHNITSVNCTPSSFYGLLSSTDMKSLQRLSSLKYVFLGGEPISIAVLQPWIKSSSFNACIVNTYGPTECTDVCAFHRLKDYDKYLTTSVPIGKPVYNTQLYILNDQLEKVPNGEKGELCIAGIGVGAGYLNRPDLTSDRFVKDPFSIDKKECLYRTGDLVRWIEDGDIEFLGRIDHQVKIRGFRIELGEIETQLAQYPDVHETVVLAREESPGEKQLVAYLVLKQGATPSVSGMRKFLQSSIPDYMLPTAWAFLDKMPLNPNGKVDRKSLPAPNRKRPQLDQVYISPRSDMEKYLVNIWCEILGFDKVGIHDRFFELGGSSIKAIQFVGRLGKELGEPIPIIKFFHAPTIAAISDVLLSEYKILIENMFGKDQTILCHNQKKIKTTQSSNKKGGSRRRSMTDRRELIKKHKQNKNKSGIGI